MSEDRNQGDAGPAGRSQGGWSRRSLRARPSGVWHRHRDPAFCLGFVFLWLKTSEPQGLHPSLMTAPWLTWASPVCTRV